MRDRAAFADDVVDVAADDVGSGPLAQCHIVAGADGELLSSAVQHHRRVFFIVCLYQHKSSKNPANKQLGL